MATDKDGRQAGVVNGGDMDHAKIDAPYEYPFEIASENEMRFRDAEAVESRPAGVPSSYDEGGSTRWTPEAISEVYALA